MNYTNHPSGRFHKSQKMNLFWYMIKNNRCCQRWKEEHVTSSINTGMPQGLWLTDRCSMSQARGGKKQTAKRAHTGVGLNLMIFQQQSIVYLALSPRTSLLCILLVCQLLAIPFSHSHLMVVVDSWYISNMLTRAVPPHWCGLQKNHMCTLYSEELT